MNGVWRCQELSRDPNCTPIKKIPIPTTYSLILEIQVEVPGGVILPRLDPMPRVPGPNEIAKLPIL
jgi:hypothetical protein